MPGSRDVNTPRPRYQVGLSLASLTDPVELTVVADLAESLDFDRLACGEHVMMPTSRTPNALTTLAYVAGITDRVRLLTSIVLAALYPPALLAKMAASVDVLSQGRLDLGIGVGGEVPVEFEACGVPLAGRGARVTESVQVMRAMWSGADRFAGTYTCFEGGRLDLPVVQPQGPPVWIAGRKGAALRRVVEVGDVWLPYLCAPGHVERGVTELANIARDAGRAPESIGVQAYCFVAVGPDPDRAREAAAEFVGTSYGQDFTGAVGSLIAAGGSADVARHLDRYRQAGADGVIVHLIPVDERQPESVRRFAHDVMPLLDRTTRTG